MKLPTGLAGEQQAGSTQLRCKAVLSLMSAYSEAAARGTVLMA
jgi:hypothetical protein